MITDNLVNFKSRCLKLDIAAMQDKRHLYTILD